MRLKSRHGCKYGLPHDLTILNENQVIKVEVCKICNTKFRWNKRKLGRVNNEKYLEAHLRNFAQKFGRTKRIYHKIYYSNKCKIKI